jgi:hypothetical protein
MRYRFKELSQKHKLSNKNLSFHAVSLIVQLSYPQSLFLLQSRFVSGGYSSETRQSIQATSHPFQGKMVEQFLVLLILELLIENGILM